MGQRPSGVQDLVPAESSPFRGRPVSIPTGASGGGRIAATGVDSSAHRTRVPAGRPRRVVAWLVDYLVVIGPGLALVAFAVASMIQTLPGFVGAVAADAGWSRLVQLFVHHAASGIGAVAADEWVTYAFPLIGALIAVPVLQFAYQGTMFIWRRRTIGMMIADLGLHSNRTHAPLRRGAAVRRAAATTFVETGLVAIALALMVVGQFMVGLGLWGVAVIAFWADALAAFGPGRRTIIDRMVGAVVVRRGLYPVAVATVASHLRDRHGPGRGSHESGWPGRLDRGDRHG